MVREIMKDPEGYDYSDAALLYIQLRSLGFLVEDSQDDAFYNITKMRALTNQYADSSLMLTIAITRACNFDCSYCFEGNRMEDPCRKQWRKSFSVSSNTTGQKMST